MIKYTNSSKSALEELKEHVAILQTSQEKLLQRLEEQQKKMMKQQQEFMQMVLAATKGTEKGTKKPPPKEVDRETTTRKRTEGKFCNGCKKKVLHKYGNCWELDKNKDKRTPNWKLCLE